MVISKSKWFQGRLGPMPGCDPALSVCTAVVLALGRGVSRPSGGPTQERPAPPNISTTNIINNWSALGTNKCCSATENSKREASRGVIDLSNTVHGQHGEEKTFS